MNMRIIIKNFTLLCVAILTLNGCLLKPFKFPTYQGNLLTSRQIEQVKPGMTSEQIQYVLGTPMLQDIFHPDEWHYIYYEKQAYKEPITRKLILSFENNRVKHITRENLSTAPSSV